MKKFSLVAATLIAGVVLNVNAATVATVNGKSISDTEVSEFFAPMLRGQDFKTLPDNQKKVLIQQYIMQDLILQDAKKQNLEKDPLYTKELDRAKDAILVNVYQEKILNTIKIDAAKVKAFYDQNKDKYVKPARVQAKHILVATEKEAKDIINELKGLKGKELDAKFSELAKEKSIDPGSKNQGGELGWFDQSTMVKPFTDAAFALKNGTITTTPVKTNFGYHVILKENSQAKGQIKFDEVKQGIENGLKFEEFKKVINQKGQDLLNSAKVEYK
ncbi:peptidylprolyl isomerase PEB4 [Campylobacter jejuni]|uniref:peptidylprolyl isomerase PEB4 n=1 Tax=Campylobacter jejuni TaxID=197 RepID=UPI000513BE76|nr:peptidylprolyl isomerase PEB4 [Campylobacter jejuni]QUP63381.1 peptidylprolyl isomerase PEB4 [Campylobacter jejuni]